ncbi:Crp/Fnr family transcriptional regulator [Algivirga pacifica]|uniref:Cyclic nucleotide-binding domain-containing protein n=1 Tax=Algivirga pacifica TaxID=1162670 RepID=A0ABP9DLM9_9BACT
MKSLFKQHIEQTLPITEEDFEFIWSHFTQKSLKKHQFLVQEDDYIRSDYWVGKGLLKAYYNNDGKEHILQFAMEGWWISDYDAYFNQTPASINVNCLEDSELICLTLANREALCQSLPQMANFFRLKAQGGYVASQKRILSFLKNNAEERYHELTTLYPTLLQRVPKTLLASYIGVSRETLSRLGKKKLNE